jgi:hypothetical protein
MTAELVEVSFNHLINLLRVRWILSDIVVYMLRSNPSIPGFPVPVLYYGVAGRRTQHDRLGGIEAGRTIRELIFLCTERE